jgi:ParB-like chromosome segregation protein Spo0J
MSAPAPAATSLLTAAQAGQLSPHSLSAIFAPMGELELGSLAADIKDSGLKEPITLHEGQILDGNNRYRACLKVGYRFKETDFRQFDPKTQGDPLACVVSSNLVRRHLNESQRAAIAAQLVTTTRGYNRYTAKGVSNEQAAQMLGVSEGTVKMAKEVAAKAAPEIQELVRKGDLRLGAAKGLLKLDKGQQVAELEKIKAEKEAEKAGKKKEKKGGSRPSHANQKMDDVDDFKKKWQGFDEMQRKAFVMSFKSELAELLEYVRQQEAMVGAQLQI